MYDIRQFRPTLYFLLMLGVTGFALAAEAPGTWILAAGGILINAWLVKTGRFTPIPRMLANVVTLGGLVLIARQIRAGDATPILTIGNFIVVLHLVKLFEQRANRDYAQLLVLSLLLMVAAAISTASLLFGIIFIVYLFVSLHCCLLFHLKVEVDQAREAYQQPADQVDPVPQVPDQRDLPRSMRRLTGLISLAGIAMAILVFLFFPRGSGQPLFGPLQPRASMALTGFSDQVNFQKIAQITRNDDVVARVEVYFKDEKVTHPGELLLRGSTLDDYTGNDATRGLWQWDRSDYNRFTEPQDVTLSTTVSTFRAMSRPIGNRSSISNPLAPTSSSPSPDRSAFSPLTICGFASLQATAFSKPKHPRSSLSPTPSVPLENCPIPPPTARRLRRDAPSSTPPWPPTPAKLP